MKTDPRASCRDEELNETSPTLSIPSFRANGIAGGARRRQATPTARPAHPGSSFARASRAPHSPRFAHPTSAFAMPRRALQRPHGELAGASNGAAAAARPPGRARAPAPPVHGGPVDQRPQPRSTAPAVDPPLMRQHVASPPGRPRRSLPFCKKVPQVL